MFDIESLKDPKRRRWIRMANIPNKYIGREVKDLDPYIDHDDVMEIVNGWLTAVSEGKVIGNSGTGLALVGAPGHGKTALALAILQTLIVRTKSADYMKVWKPSNSDAVGALRHPVWWGYYPELLANAKQAMGDDEEATALEDDLFGRSRNPDDHVRILVVDDLGKEHRTTSGWAENYFDHLLRTRFYRGYPTIVTSNVDRDKWGTFYGPSMDSFAKEALYTVSIVSKKDRRG